MTMRIRVGLVLMLALAMLGLASCDHYTCQATFGASTCTGGQLTLGQSGGGPTTSAFVFAVDSGSNGTNGTIDGFTVDSSSDTFQAISGFTGPTLPLNDGGVGMAVAQSQFLYAGIAGELYGWSISSSGALTAVNGSPYAASFLDNFLVSPGEAYMIANPAGTVLYISSQATNQIYAYSIGSGGVLTAVAGSPFTASFSLGFGPNNLAIDGLGKYLYASNGDASTHTASQVLTYSIGSGGALTQVGSAVTLSMWLLKGEPTGKFMIGTSGNNLSFSGRDDLNLYIFNIGSNGTLTESASATTIYSPWNIAVQSNSGGDLVYSFSFNDTDTAFNPPEGFQIESNGTLQMLSSSPFSGLTNGSWGQFDQSGTLLVDWANYTSNGVSVTTLTPFAVGSGGLLTQPFGTLDLNNPGFWVVTDPQ